MFFFAWISSLPICPPSSPMYVPWSIVILLILPGQSQVFSLMSIPWSDLLELICSVFKPCNMNHTPFCSILNLYFLSQNRWIKSRDYVLKCLYFPHNLSVVCRESLLNMYWMNYCEIIFQIYELFCVFFGKCSVITLFPLMNFLIFFVLIRNYLIYF